METQSKTEIILNRTPPKMVLIEEIIKIEGLYCKFYKDKFWLRVTKFILINYGHFKRGKVPKGIYEKTAAKC